MPNHCFDGQLIACKHGDGLRLEDTYWNSGDNRVFTLEEALRLGTLEFVCNLNDVEKSHKSDLKYYDNKDIFDLSYQHHCYESYYRRKGAKRSKTKMLETVNKKLVEAQREAEYQMRKIEQLSATRTKIELDDLTVYI